MSALWLVIALAVPKATPDAPKKLVAPKTHAPSGVTRCAACHVTAGWVEVKFDHAKTGFPLRGLHARVSCKACHPQDFEASVPRSCAGCHRDAHAGELGSYCQGCHEETGWKATFNADAHRRTNFPLVGRHGLLPCESCHGEVRERRFARATVDCVACHLRDYQRTAAAAVDHFRFGLGTLCGQCHGPFRFSPARFPGHDACFHVSSGSHARIGCLGCHTSLAEGVTPGACSTNTAACTSCHTHRCGADTATDRLHEKVLGYQCKDRKCYECHRFGAPL